MVVESPPCHGSEMAPVRRPIAAAATLIAAATLAGCELTGSIDVTLDAVTVDLRARQSTGEVFGACTNVVPPDPIRRRIENPDVGVITCHYTGTMSLDEARNSPLHLSQSDGTVSMIMLPSHWWYWAAGASAPDDDLDVTMTFPGRIEVATANGIIDGGRVRFVDVDAVRSEGISVMSRPEGPDPDTVTAGWQGLTLGLTVVGGTWLALWLRRRIAIIGTQAAEPITAADAGAWAAPPSEPVLGHDPPEDPAVWASED